MYGTCAYISSYESGHKACAGSWQTKSKRGKKRRTGHHTLEEEILTTGHLPVEDHISKNILAVQTGLDGDERERGGGSWVIREELGRGK